MALFLRKLCLLCEGQIYTAQKTARMELLLENVLCGSQTSFTQMGSLSREVWLKVKCEQNAQAVRAAGKGKCETTIITEGHWPMGAH